jgi:hypothetical protein
LKKNLPIIIKTTSIIVILIIGFLLIRIFVIQDKYEPDKKQFSTEFKNGLWKNSMDSLSDVDIKNGKWIFLKSGISDSGNVYEMKITSDLPKFVDRLLNPNEFLILSNKTDTLYYEIMGSDVQLFILRHFPSGKIYVYNSE